MAVYAFRGTYPLFKRITNPLLAITVGGALLGVLGIVGGPITLFKGLDEMKQLALDASQYTAAGLALVTLVKTAAVVIAGTCGFRGGRIFPSVFIGVAAGLFAGALLPSVHHGADRRILRAGLLAGDYASGVAEPVHGGGRRARDRPDTDHDAGDVAGVAAGEPAGRRC